jgi:hypothetical protein
VAKKDKDLTMVAAALNPLADCEKALPLFKAMAAELPRKPLNEQDELGSVIVRGLDKLKGEEAGPAIAVILSDVSSKFVKGVAASALASRFRVRDAPASVREAAEWKFWEAASDEKQAEVIDYWRRRFKIELPTGTAPPEQAVETGKTEEGK